MLTVIASGVTQQPLPAGETCSQAPPVAVDEATEKSKFELVLAMVTTCGNGFAPANGMLKLNGFTCSKTGSPTSTTIGTVTLLPVAVKTNSPTNVPEVRPPPGRLAGVIDTAKVVGATPLAGPTFSQLPPSAVLLATVQFSDPVPLFRICRVW